jgi:hypothetical protein
MKKQSAQITQNECRKNERGAALVTVLMITFLLLVAVIALLLETSMNTANVTDATAEEQAYYAAESGIQSVIKFCGQSRRHPESFNKPGTVVGRQQNRLLLKPSDYVRLMLRVTVVPMFAVKFRYGTSTGRVGCRMTRFIPTALSSAQRPQQHSQLIRLNSVSLIKLELKIPIT